MGPDALARGATPGSLRIAMVVEQSWGEVLHDRGDKSPRSEMTATLAVDATDPGMKKPHHAYQMHDGAIVAVPLAPHERDVIFQSIGTHPSPSSRSVVPQVVACESHVLIGKSRAESGTAMVSIRPIPPRALKECFP